MRARIIFNRLLMVPWVRGRIRIVSLSRCVAALLLVAIGAPAGAHSPHHVIDDLEISPDYARDSTVFVLIYTYLMRSDKGAGSWRQLVNGLDTPYILTDVEMSNDFASDQAVFVATEGSGVYKSDDRGESWSAFNAGLSQKNIGKLLTAVSGDNQVLLAAGVSRGLFASATGTPDWRRVMSDDVQVTALRQIHTDSGRFVLVGDSNGGIWKSEGDLLEWERIAWLDGVGRITAFAAGRSADGKGMFLVGTASAGLLEVSPDGAVVGNLSKSWPLRTVNCKGRQLEAPLPDLNIQDIETGNDGEDILVTTWNTAVRISRDGGKSWSLADEGLRCNAQADAPAFSVSHFRGLAIDGFGDGDWFLASFEGLYRSDNQGKTWVQFETMPVSLIRGMAISPSSDGGQHALILTTYGGGAYAGLDQGRSWHVLNKGLVTTRLSDAAFVPGSSGDDLRVFALADERLLELESVEDGWVASSLVYRGWRRRIGAGLEKYLGFSSEYGKDLFLDYSERHGVWPMQIDLSPSFVQDGTMLVGFRRRGIWVSKDGGETWDREWSGPRDYVTDLVVSPRFDVDGTAFSAVRGAGVYVTRDRSESWKRASTGLDYLGDWKPAASPNHNIDPPISRAITDVVLAVSPDFAEDSTVLAGSAAGVFRSRNAAIDWQKLRVLEPGQNESTIALAISPEFHTDRFLIASLKGRGLWASNDGGESFHQMGESLLRDNAEVRFIAFSPTFQSDGIIYAASDWDLWKSGDSGANWSRIPRPFRYEDWRGESPGPVWFEGNWARESGPEFSASVQTGSDHKGDRATLNFYGQTISWFGERGPSAGKARVSIDGSMVEIVDLYNDSVVPRSRIWTANGLEKAPHRIVIEVLGEKNPQSSGYRVTVDSIDVERD
jgi:photosystem II stability/assembly factor-like uncharacterized protein